MDFADIMDEIVANITGEYKKDMEYLRQQEEKYKDHEFAEAIMRECRDLRNDCLNRIYHMDKLDPYKTKQCRHCGTYVQDGEKYCRHCGQSVVDPRIAGFDYHAHYVLYGPPPAFAEAECKSCGIKWKIRSGEYGKEDHKRYCPQCGALIEIKKFTDYYKWVKRKEKQEKGRC